MVTEVEPDSNSADAGLQQGDVIVEINRQPVNNAEEAVKLCTQAKGQSDSAQNLAARAAASAGTSFSERGQHQDAIRLRLMLIAG